MRQFFIRYLASVLSCGEFFFLCVCVLYVRSLGERVEEIYLSPASSL